jgi:hypothetical protein
VVVGLFHEEEQDDESPGTEDGTPVLGERSVFFLWRAACTTAYQDPLPALTVIDEARYHGGEEVAAGEKKRIHAKVCASLMREVLVAT